MKQPKPVPVSRAGARRFLLRFAAIIAAGVFVYWLGWRSPWARADQRVMIVTPDAPKPMAANNQTATNPAANADRTDRSSKE